MKKMLLAAVAALSSVASFAAESTGVEYAGSVGETIATQTSGTLTNFLTGVAPTIAGIIGAGLAIWGGIALVGILKRAFSAGKGR